MRRVFFLIVASFFSFNVFAEDFSQNKYVIKINKALAKVSHLTVKFRQSAGSATERGTMYYAKNVGLIAKYETIPVSILVNKSAITYYDSSLDQKSQLPTKESASEIFTKPLELSSKDFTIQSVEKIDGAVKVVAFSKKNKAEGEFTMYFSEGDYTLRRVDIASLDGGEAIKIDLYSHDYSKISAERFKAVNIEKSEV